MKSLKTLKNVRSLNRGVLTFIAIALIAVTAIATKFALGAGTATITATVNDNTVSVGDDVVVTVTANTGSTSANVARARVMFDSSKWQYISEDYTGVSFVDRTPEPPNRVGTGYHEVTGYKISAPFPTGSFVIGRFTLRALAATSGTTPITVDRANSEIYDASVFNTILGSVTGTTVTITGGSNPAPTIEMYADNPTLGATDGGTNINWKPTNATSCTASGGWSGSKAATNTYHNEAISPSTDTNYTLSCTGAGGTIGKTIRVFKNVGTTRPRPVFFTYKLYEPSPAPGKLTFTLEESDQEPNPSATQYYWLLIDGEKAGPNLTSAGPKNTFTYTPSSPLSATNHSIQAIAFDSAGNATISADGWHLDLTDTTPPVKPTGVTAQYKTSPQRIEVNWDVPSDENDVDAWEIYRDDSTTKSAELVSVVNGQHVATQYVDTAAAALTSGSHTYVIKARDASGNLSAASTPKATATVTGTPVDTTPPDAPGSFVAQYQAGPPKKVHLTWTKPSDNGGTGVQGYRIWRDGTDTTHFLATINNGNTLVYDDVSAGGLAPGPHTYTIKAFDGAPSPGPYTSAAATTNPPVTVPDTDPPTPTPTLKSAVVTPSPQKITFELNTPLPTDASGVKYKLYQGSTCSSGTLRMSSITLNAQNKFDYSPSTPLGPGSYNFRITAIDNAPAPGPYETACSGPLSVPVADTTAPTPVPTLTAHTVQASPQAITFTVSPSTDDSGATPKYSLFKDGDDTNPILTNIVLSGSNTFVYTPSPALNVGTHTFNILAYDNAPAPGPNKTAHSPNRSVPIVDTIKPNTITTLTGIRQTTPNQVHLTWSDPGDNPGGGVVKYRIERISPDGTITTLNTINAPTTVFNDTSTLDQVGDYIYKVYALDAVPLESNASNPSVTVTTTDTTKPIPPSTLTATYQASPDRINLAWNDGDDNVAVTGYKIYRDSTFITTVDDTVHTYTDSGLSTGTYTYTVAAIDAVPLESDPSPAAQATVPSSSGQKPTTPGGVAAAYQASPKQINLTWTASTDPDGNVVRYEVWRDGVKVKDVTAPATSTSDNSVDSLKAGNHSYVIYAVDDDTPKAHFSDPSTPPAPVTVPDTEKPTTPRISSVVRQTSPSIRNRITWVAATDNVALDHYEVFRDGARIAPNISKTATSYLDTSDEGQKPGLRTYTVIAFDTATPNKNQSDPQNPPGSVVIPDVDPPDAIDDLAAEIQTSPNQVHLTWSTPFDYVGVTGYRITRDGADIGTSTTPSFNDTSSLSVGNHTYVVYAHDGATPQNNESDPSNAVTVTVGDEDDPTPPASFSATFRSNPYRVDMTWQPSSDGDGAGVDHYDVYRDGIFLASTTDTKYTDETVLSYGDHTYFVKAVDAAQPTAHESDSSNTDTITAPDIEAPTAPTNVNGEFQDNPQQINLTWDAASDGSGTGVDHYEIYRDGVSIGTTTTTHFTSSGPYEAGDYRFVVYAVDGAEPKANVSEASDPPTVVAVPDTEAPSTPSDLIGGFRLNPDRVELSWQGSHDNVGVNHYSILRDGVEVGTSQVSSTSFIDSTVEANSSYTYSVTAVDGADPANISEASNQITVYVPPVDPTPPIAPQGLSASYSADEQKTVLTWQPATDNVGVVNYQIVMDGAAVIGNTGNTSFVHNVYLAPGQHTYQVFALDARENKSPGSNIATITVSQDDRGAVDDTVTFQPSVDEDTEQVGFMVDDNIVATATEEPFTAVIDTNTLSNGEHCLTTTTTDKNNKTESSKDCSLLVDNRKGAEKLVPLRKRDRLLLALAIGLPIIGLSAFGLLRHRH